MSDTSGTCPYCGRARELGIMGPKCDCQRKSDMTLPEARRRVEAILGEGADVLVWALGGGRTCREVFSAQALAPEGHSVKWVCGHESESSALRAIVAAVEASGE